MEQKRNLIKKRIMKKRILLLIAVSLFTKLSIAQVSLTDFNALIALYNATGGNNWTDKTNWSTTVNNVSDNWYGVKISGGRVVEIDLHNNNLIGSVPSEIGNLSSLYYLFLNDNKLTSIPMEIGGLSELTKLYIGSNLLSNIPSEICNLNKLVELSICKNQLTNIPNEIGDLSALKYFDLSVNQLTSIPVGIGKLSALTDLYLGANKLTTVPIEIGNLSSLKTLSIVENQLTSIPSEIGKLTALESLRLHYNQLTNIPVEIGNLSSITYLGIGSNLIASIPAEIGNLSLLEYLSLFNNKLTFEDIESNIGIASISFDYSPQAKIGLKKEVYSDIGNPVKLVVEVGGDHNIYKWYKNDIEIANSNNDTLIIASYSNDDKGTYVCKIINSIAAALTIESEPIYLMLTGINDIRTELAKIYPNPSNGNFNITLDKMPDQNCRLEMLDLNGKIIYKQELNKLQNQINLLGNYQGTYIIQIIENNNVYGSYKILLMK